MKTKYPTTHSTQEHKPLTFFEVVGSTFASTLGVLSLKNRLRDFSRGTVIAALLLLLTACVQQSLLSTSENTLQVASNVILAGALTEEAAALIKRRGAVVIDLRGADEGVNVEAEQMQAIGVPYFNLPVSAGSFDHTVVNKLDRLLLQHSTHPIVVHCVSGNRAGLLWGALLKERGLSSTSAQSAVAEIVTKDGVRQAIDQYTPEAKQ